MTIISVEKSVRALMTCQHIIVGKKFVFSYSKKFVCKVRKLLLIERVKKQFSYDYADSSVDEVRARKPLTL